jgi:PAS domain S-box-containing protein
MKEMAQAATPRSPLARPRELLSLLAAILVVLLIATLAWRTSRAFTRQNARLDNAEQVISQTEAILSDMKDAETAQRGYLLTGKESYLDPWRQAVESTAPALNDLSRLMAGFDQGKSVEVLRPLIQAKLDELRQTIDLRRNNQPDAALAIVATGEGKGLMDQIRQTCDAIVALADIRLTQDADDARASDARLGLIGTLGSIGILILLIVSLVTIQRGIRRRQLMIQALKASEAATREARDWLQTTLGSIGDAVIATDAAGNVTFLNAVAAALTGWPASQAAGLPLERIFSISSEETGAVAESPVGKVLREGRIAGLANHTKLTARDGREIPIEDSAAPIRGPEGNIAGVVLVFRDVTERREAEKEIEQSSLRFQFMADNAPVLIWTTGVDGLCNWFNKPWLTLVGRSLEAEVGEGWFQHVHPDDAEHCLSIFKVAFRARQPFTREFRLRRSDGQYSWMLDQGTPLHDPAGAFTGYIGSSVAITERKEAEEELRRANDDLKQFAFAASHDLQEPLRVITSYSQLLLQGFRGQLEGDAAIYVRFITESAHRMRELLSDLLTYTQVGVDSAAFSGNVDLNLILQEALANLRVMIADSKAEITCGQLPVLTGHAAHFLQLFQNLISNALKYKGPDPPRIRISAELVDGVWRLAVADNGIGIEPEYHQSVFGVFKRLHGRSVPGTGIGLAICQRVVDRHGGRIWVESQPNQGATFYMTFPA